ncbi:hypothetical protein [Mesorhizobium koreense]|uniref:hypothetical protein n=1 Tax=Mesorhizobium koreense TaxID=3074855 RepID=UPI00287B7BAC|nr:hypothetical protein [Mesorhizobium sp. WR6]
MPKRKRQSLAHMTPEEKAAHKREQERLKKRRQRGSTRTERGRPMKLLDDIEGVEVVRDFPLYDFVSEIAGAGLGDAMILCDMRRKQKGEMPEWGPLPEPENPTKRFCPELFELGYRPWSKLIEEDRARMRELQKQLDDTPAYRVAADEYREAHAAWRAARERRASFNRADVLAQMLKPLEGRADAARRKTKAEAAALDMDYRDRAMF